VLEFQGASIFTLRSALSNPLGEDASLIDDRCRVTARPSFLRKQESIRIILSSFLRKQESIRIILSSFLRKQESIRISVNARLPDGFLLAQE
jgi:hypothetical protein